MHLYSYRRSVAQLRSCCGWLFPGGDQDWPFPVRANLGQRARARDVAAATTARRHRRIFRILQGIGVQSAGGLIVGLTRGHVDPLKAAGGIGIGYAACGENAAGAVAARFMPCHPGHRVCGFGKDGSWIKGAAEWIHVQSWFARLEDYRPGSQRETRRHSRVAVVTFTPVVRRDLVWH